MTEDQEMLSVVLDASELRREERRKFIKYAGAATLAVGGSSLLAACGSNNNGNNNTGTAPTPTPTPAPAPSPSPSPSPSASPTTAVTDNDILNFALNLEYLEAQFYSYAAYGVGLPAAMLTGTGTPGPVTGGRQVNFTDTLIAQYAREIANDEITHVAFLRRTLGSAAVAQPALNIDGSDTGAFTAAARAAGVVSATGRFDPYSSDDFFLLGAYIFEDVGVTAYKGASPLIASPAILEAAAGILAAEAYHAGLVRTIIYARGIQQRAAATAESQNVSVAANLISDARDTLDGSTDLDQGPVDINGNSNIVPADPNGIAFSRSAGQVLNVVYLTSAAAVGGGFFPAGMNGRLRMSAASGG